MLAIRRKQLFSLLLCVCLMIGSSFATPKVAPSNTSEPITLTVSAAASLKDALFVLEKNYENQHPGVKIDFNLAASGALRKQIEEGAPADLFLSADTKNIDALSTKQLILPSSQTILLGNELVLLANKSVATKVKSAKDLSKKEIRFIGIGTPESVPAGAYAKEALTSLKLWDKLGSKYVFGKDVKQVMSYVETGNAEAAIVYASDAKLAKNSVVALRFDTKNHSPIRYGAAVIKASLHPKEAEAFLNYLRSSEAQKVFKAYGFTAAK